MQIDALQQACQRQLAGHITIDSVFPCYSAADSLSDDKLKTACIEFIACLKNRYTHAALHTAVNHTPMQHPLLADGVDGPHTCTMCILALAHNWELRNPVRLQLRLELQLKQQSVA